MSSEVEAGRLLTGEESKSVKANEELSDAERMLMDDLKLAPEQVIIV